MEVNLVFAYLKKRRKKTTFQYFWFIYIPDHNYAINANSTNKMF